MEQELTNIYLSGKLGAKFGKVWRLYVSSPAEAIKAININTGGKFRDYLTKQGHDKFYKVSLGNKKSTLNRMELGNRTGNRDIYILPTVKGNKSGFGQIIAGIVLIAAAYFGVPATASAFFQTVAQGVIYTGISMILGGVIQLVFPAQGFNANQDATATAGSNIFQGNATAIAQGGAVGLVYGRALVSPMPISIAFANFDQSPNYGGGNGGIDNNPAGAAGGGGAVATNFPGSTYYDYEVNTDFNTGLTTYVQNLTPIVARPASY